MMNRAGFASITCWPTIGVRSPEVICPQAQTHSTLSGLIARGSNNWASLLLP